MRKPDPTETALSELRRIDDARELAPYFRNRSSLVVARAAARAAELEGGDLTTELVQAFRRLIANGLKLDKGCQALTNIATALAKRDANAAEVYYAGIRHIQWEPVWGGSVDVAGPLRAMCAIGMVRMGHPEALFSVTDLLVDARPEARAGAIRALAESGKPEAELLLRYKARVGDEAAEVTSECFAAVIRLSPPGRALPFVAEFIDAAKSEVSEAAALALGESRLAAAFPLLAAAFERRPEPGLRNAILWAMALLRSDEGIEFLFRQVTEGSTALASVALQSLGFYKADEVLRARVEAAVGQRGSEALGKAFSEHWRS